MKEQELALGEQRCQGGSFTPALFDDAEPRSFFGEGEFLGTKIDRKKRCIYLMEFHKSLFGMMECHGH